ncbi:hypothetical protein ABID22_004003 [Pontibacter aydingkolensis]|uniref:DUF1835 domain-containing protein n=1 Tax=Pontibacter aydingkolensis TaxID=1911536 RepID=A0ABS7CZG8_9BACT|nr:DUF1835 domain-containing protein [Pontibacter aydingkolensis]MBW7469248.1 DUF1835 domain-containing protein [Pontibacter aydingkolensis]
MKKLPSLHILNGDASLPAFEAANLPGQVLIWREVLSEGPAIGSLPEQEFWQKRQEFITQTYNETPDGYSLKVLDVLEKLNMAHAFFEVILWFDADLMCQVNLLYLLQKLSQVKPGVISVCTPADGKSIGYLTADALHQVFENRQMQKEYQLQQAQQLWQLYAGPDPMQLQAYLQQHDICIPNLQKALELHLRRFPNCKTGLTEPETLLLQSVKNGSSTVKQVIKQFWEKQPAFGFGDWQLEYMLQELQPELVQEKEPLSLTPLAEKVLQGEEAFKHKPQWIGGAYITPNQGWCFDTNKQTLQPC